MRTVIDTLWITVEPQPGAIINHVIDDLVHLVNSIGKPVSLVFNGRKIEASPGDCPKCLYRKWAGQ